MQQAHDFGAAHLYYQGCFACKCRHDTGSVGAVSPKTGKIPSFLVILIRKRTWTQRLFLPISAAAILRRDDATVTLLA
jgi:hypothetical protein